MAFRDRSILELPEIKVDAVADEGLWVLASKEGDGVPYSGRFNWGKLMGEINQLISDALKEVNDEISAMRIEQMLIPIEGEAVLFNNIITCALKKNRDVYNIINLTDNTKIVESADSRLLDCGTECTLELKNIGTLPITIDLSEINPKDVPLDENFELDANSYAEVIIKGVGLERRTTFVKFGVSQGTTEATYSLYIDGESNPVLTPLSQTTKVRITSSRYASGVFTPMEPTIDITGAPSWCVYNGMTQVGTDPVWELSFTVPLNLSQLTRVHTFPITNGVESIDLTITQGNANLITYTLGDHWDPGDKLGLFANEPTSTDNTLYTLFEVDSTLSPITVYWYSHLNVNVGHASNNQTIITPGNGYIIRRLKMPERVWVGEAYEVLENKPIHERGV